LYYKVNGSGKQKMRVILWNFAVLERFYSSYQTGGLIDRYANKDAGTKIQSTDWSRRYCSNRIMFLDNPIVGVGVGGQRKNG
jgi:hypothetical protein